MKNMLVKLFWCFAPWQKMQTAPYNIRCLVLHKQTGVITIVKLANEEEKNWYKKWLPLPEVNNLKVKPVSELFAHDVLVYEDNAYLMWEISENSRWCQLQSNLPATIKSEPRRFRRKQSAALPFDLERAKAGDVVEWRNDCDDTWDTCEFVTESNDNGFFEIISSCGIDKKYVLACELRMKYPKKVNYE